MSTKSRLIPDPSVGVCDIEKQIWEVTERRGCKDLWKILECKQGVTWKSAPLGDWLGSDEMCDFFSSMFSIHGNGVIAATKLKKSLLLLQQHRGRVNFTKYHDNDWSDKLDTLIRIGAQQYRDLKRDPLKYSRCVKKCGLKEKKNIDKVLSFLVFPEGAEQPDGGEVAQEVACAAPEEAPAVANAKAEGSPEQVPQPAVPGLVFSRVLAREASDPASPNFARKQSNDEYKTEQLPSSSWERPGSMALAAVGLEKDEGS